MGNMKSIFNACVISFAFQAFGCLGIGYFKSFMSTCAFTVVRSAGSNLAWIDSSLLLQSYSKPDMLGRVIAVDFALALFGESFSALLVGEILDGLGFTAREVSLLMGYTAVFIFVLWSIYRFRDPQLE
jgi:hypothetical protein